MRFPHKVLVEHILAKFPKLTDNEVREILRQLPYGLSLPMRGMTVKQRYRWLCVNHDLDTRLETYGKLLQQSVIHSPHKLYVPKIC